MRKEWKRNSLLDRCDGSGSDIDNDCGADTVISLAKQFIVKNKEVQNEPFNMKSDIISTNDFLNIHQQNSYRIS